MLAFWFVILPLISQTTTATDVISGCRDTCGTVHVPYPFGINFTSGISNPDYCALNKHFILTCNVSDDTPSLFFGENMPIHNISIKEGTISVRIDSAYNCYNETGRTHNFSQQIRLHSGPPVRFSDTRNKFTVVGCDTLALFEDGEMSFASGCISWCGSNVTQNGSCSGRGCCQTPLPRNLTAINIGVSSIFNHSGVWQFNPCEFAFLADESTFNFSNLQLSSHPYSRETKKYFESDVVEWAVREETCDEAKSPSNPDKKYACGQNTDCFFSENVGGYRCNCTDGFTGNPYLPQGCQDIDECKERERYKCDGTCKNTNGNYTCSCPLGMRGDGKVGCQGFRITTIAAIVGGVASIMVIAFLIIILYKRRRNERNFLKNGGLLLKHQRVRIFRIFTEAELVKATKNYDPSLLLGEGGFGYVYKGVLADNTQVAVKKPKDKDKTQINQEFQQELGIVSQVNHRNVVKVLGLCLETKVPLLVYEFISNGTLFQHIHYYEISSKNAARLQLALDYLHSSTPIIHGDVKSCNILLDDTYTAKVSDFGASVLISTGQSDMATRIQGTIGYLDPEYLMTGNLTEKSDVYSFGVVLVELLTGEKPNSSARSGEKSNIIQYFLSSLENNELSRILCFDVASETEMEEIEVFAELAKQCVRAVESPLSSGPSLKSRSCLSPSGRKASLKSSLEPMTTFPLEASVFYINVVRLGIGDYRVEQLWRKAILLSNWPETLNLVIALV
ncbi:LOW QUALITY PROTEIN: wall-associated receptor kinase 2 [Jatropha curcas]|uniref:LOW QUALITY PROTEIN: wall-associated receptor kinase 2 n=1 Tax=Jatropha curcas TaxID=180498 RepID=UPI001895A6CE|nr:LOW QUALITY PROTEIN: wall-associated receptor kinase 2 [Jatropha curcas]